MIAAGDSNGIIRLLTVENDRISEIGSFNTDQGNLNSIDWNYQPYNGKSDQYLLATTGSMSGDVKIWEIDLNGNQLTNPKLTYPKDWKFSDLSLRFSEDGNNLVLGGEKGQVFLIKNINNSDRQQINKKLPLPTEVESKVTIGFSKDNQSFTIVSKEGKIWRSTMEPKLINDLPIETYQAGTENITVSEDGTIATGGAGAALRLWDPHGRQIADFRGYWGTIKSVNFSKDSKYLLAGGDDGIPRVWQIDRQIPDLIKQGCQWLDRGYFQSHSFALTKPLKQGIDSDLQDICSD